MGFPIFLKISFHFAVMYSFFFHEYEFTVQVPTFFEKYFGYLSIFLISLIVIAALNYEVSTVTADSQVATGVKVSAGTVVTSLRYGWTGTKRKMIIFLMMSD